MKETEVNIKTAAKKVIKFGTKIKYFIGSNFASLENFFFFILFKNNFYKISSKIISAIFIITIKKLC